MSGKKRKRRNRLVRYLHMHLQVCQANQTGGGTGETAGRGDEKQERGRGESRRKEVAGGRLNDWEEGTWLAKCWAALAGKPPQKRKTYVKAPGTPSTPFPIFPFCCFFSPFLLQRELLHCRSLYSFSLTNKTNLRGLAHCRSLNPPILTIRRIRFFFFLGKIKQNSLYKTFCCN